MPVYLLNETALLTIKVRANSPRFLDISEVIEPSPAAQNLKHLKIILKKGGHCHLLPTLTDVFQGATFPFQLIFKVDTEHDFNA